MQKLQYNNQEVHYQQISTFFYFIKTVKQLKTEQFKNWLPLHHVSVLLCYIMKNITFLASAHEALLQQPQLIKFPTGYIKT